MGSPAWLTPYGRYTPHMVNPFHLFSKLFTFKANLNKKQVYSVSDIYTDDSSSTASQFWILCQGNFQYKSSKYICCVTIIISEATL